MFGDKIKQLREEKRLLQRQVSAALEMDNALYCKIERGDRIARREHVVKLAELFGVNQDALINVWLADKIYSVINGENNIPEVLNIVAENLVEYGKK